MSRSDWIHVLLLVPAALPLPEASRADAIALTRDVLAGPPPIVDEETRAVIRARTAWTQGIHSDVDARGLLEGALGRRPRERGRVAARVYLARLEGGTAASWIAQLDAVEAGVRLAAGDGVWRVPRRVIVWRSQTAGLERAISDRLPGAAISWVSRREDAAAALRVRR